jgi:hypothetical protein
MRNRVWIWLCQVVALLVIHLVFSAAVYSQATAYVTSIQIQGTLTDPNATYSDANGIVTITINRSPDLADWHILVSWYDARYPSNYLVDVYDPVNMVRWGGKGGSTSRRA